MTDAKRQRSQWFCQHKGRTIGPLTSEEMRKGVERGHVTPDTLVRSGPDGEWLKASRVKGLFGPQSSTSSSGAASRSQSSPSRQGGEPPRPAPVAPSNSLFDDMLPDLAAAAAAPAPVIRSGNARRRYGKSRNPWRGAIIGGVVVGVVIAFIGGIALAVKFVQGTPKTPEERIAIAEASTALIEGKASSATGFMVAPGMLVTTERVTRAGFMSMLSVRFPGAPAGQQGPFEVDLLHVDKKRDLAVLAISTKAEPLELASSFTPGKDAPAIVVCNGEGTGESVKDNAVCRGKFSESKPDDKTYRLSVKLDSNRPGAPLLNETGEVVGFIRSPSFATTLDDLSDVVDEAVDASTGQISKLQTENRLSAGFSLQLMFSGTFSQISAGYQQFIAAAGRQGVDVAQASAIFQKEIAANTNRLNEVLPQDLIAREMKTLSEDTNLPQGLRDDLAKLWENNQEVLRLFQSPGGSAADNIRQTQELSAANQPLIDRIKKAAAEAKFILDLGAQPGINLKK